MLIARYLQALSLIHISSTRWLDKHIKAKKRYSAPLAKFKDEIERRQNKLKDLEGLFHVLINEIKEINREVSIGEAKARRAKKEMVEANLRLVISIAKKYTCLLYTSRCV